LRKYNIIFLIDSFIEMKDKSFSLHLIGAGPLREKMEKHVAELKAKNVFIKNKYI